MSVYPRRRASEFTCMLTNRSQASVQNAPRSPRAISVSDVRVICDPDPAPLELIAQQQADLQGDILLPGSAREEDPRVSRIDPAVAGIDGDDVARDGARSASRLALAPVPELGPRRPGEPAGIDQAGPPPIVAIALAQIGGQNLGDELKREEKGVAGD